MRPQPEVPMTQQEWLSNIYGKLRTVHSHLRKGVLHKYGTDSVHLAGTNAQNTYIPVAII